MPKKGPGRPKVSQAEKAVQERTRSFLTRLAPILVEEQDLRAPFPIVALLMATAGFVRPQDYDAIEARANTLLAREVK